MRIRLCTTACRTGSRPPAGPARRRAGLAPGREAPPAAPVEGFTEAAALPAPGRAASAARAFSAGNGYLSGQIVDRLL